MSGIRRTLWTAGMVTAVMCLPPSSPAAATTLRCGGTVTEDVVLKADLVDCGDSGLTIGADGVTIDLDGHTIAGANAGGAGVRVAGFADATIEDGTLRGFNVGVAADDAPAVRIRNLDLSDAGGTFDFFRGIAVFDSAGARITGNHVSGGGFAITMIGSAEGVVARNTAAGTESPPGIFGITSSSGLSPDLSVTVAHNRVSGYHTHGIEVGTASHARIVDNVVTDSGTDSGAGLFLLVDTDSVAAHNRLERNGTGIEILGGAGNRVVHNDVRDSAGCGAFCGTGIAFLGGTGNLAARNVVRRSEQVGMSVDAIQFLVADGNRLRANVVRGAGTDGIAVGLASIEARAANTVLERNRVEGAGDDGFDVREPPTTLTANLARRNGDFGIEAVPGVADGGRNRAFGNGNPLQCLNVRCVGDW